MNSLRQWKQLELYSEYPRQTASRDTSSEEFIASRLSESPTGQIRLMESILERNNPPEADKHEPRCKAGDQEQRCPRSGWYDCPQDKEVS
jgi:hypothetical protein